MGERPTVAADSLQLQIQSGSAHDIALKAGAGKAVGTAGMDVVLNTSGNVVVGGTWTCPPKSSSFCGRGCGDCGRRLADQEGAGRSQVTGPALQPDAGDGPVPLLHFQPQAVENQLGTSRRVEHLENGAHTGWPNMHVE